MRVAVCVDPLAGLSSADAGTAIARAFAAQGFHCAVIPVGQAARGAAEALADILDAEPRPLDLAAFGVPDGTVATAAVSGSDAVLAVSPGADERRPGFAGTSESVGLALRALLAAAPGITRVFIDPGPTRWHDAGAGFLAALGADADGSLRDGAQGLSGAARLDLEPARDAVGRRELVLLVPEADQSVQLSGLRGVTSVVGHDRGDDLAQMLSVDGALRHFAGLCGASELATTDGAGAIGGLGFAVLVLGGRVLTGFDACCELAGLDRALGAADLVVVGTDRLDFGSWDKFSLLPIARRVDSRVPVIAINRRTRVSLRELRTQSIESAHSLVDADDVVPTAAEITARVAPIAASWRVG